jgi:hypothetical protein
MSLVLLMQKYGSIFIAAIAVMGYFIYPVYGM